ncbi:single-strand DNA endonuclease ASTE1 [Diretmus argenteus]
MGVPGLTSYVEGNRQFFQDVKFRDSRLVVDGCSLYFRLYFTNGLDQQHGGDYDAFSFLVSQFLSALAACSIQAYVVLDGGMDPSDKKFSTLRQRLQSRIKDADKLSHGHNGSILPLLTHEVFIQVLTQSRVPVVQCPAEADWEIACLAHQWKCPVLTNDSDFYIFDLPGGYLPLNFFHWTNLNGKAPHHYISARRYTTNGLCRRFGGMNRELLPLCAALTGNDYGRPKGAETLLALIDVSGSGRGGGRGKGKAHPSHIEGLLLWLSSFSGPGEALEEVSRLMGEVDRDGGGRGKRGETGKLSSQLWECMQEYHITPHSSLAHWFSGGRAGPGEQKYGSGQLPECLSQAAAQGLLSSLVLNALVLHRVLLFPQVENIKLASSHCSARVIRQAIYGILLQRAGLGQDVQVQGRGSRAQDVKVRENSQSQRGGRGRGRGPIGVGRGLDQSLPIPQGIGSGQGASAAAVQVQSSSTPVCVEEYDRLDLNLKKNQVEAHPVRTPLCLDTLGQAPVAVRLGVLLEVLGVKESVLASIPLHLRLAVGVTGFWLREASPPPSMPQLHALLLGMVYGELSWNNQPGATHYHHAVPQLNWAAERSVLVGLGKQRVRPGERRGLDLGVAHSFSQWQACLWSALCLNQLLLVPLPEPNISWLFSGSLVHGLVRSLRGGQPAESFLAGGSLCRQLYCSLLDAVKNCKPKAHPSSAASSGRKKRGSRRGRKGRGGGGQRGTEELNNRFSLLMSEEEFDDDDD